MDKPPVALWMQAISAKIFGFSPLSLLVPEALAGKIVSNQGVRMGRPSQIHIAIGLDGKEITEVKVGGRAVVVGEGTLSAG